MGLGLLAAIASCFLAARASAGPPFLTDDPEPVGFGHYEAYLFTTLDIAGRDLGAQMPAFEFNVGAAPDLQLHLVAPFSYSSPHEAASTFGYGDTEIGAKYRFVHETERVPQVGVFPMLEVPSGDSSRGLGNGRTWAKLPLWVQKSWGPWTTYGGVGYAINTAPGARSYPFGGWLLQRDLTERLTLGGECFAQGPTMDGEDSTAYLDLGGYYNFKGDFSLLFSCGHSIVGDEHTIAYVGLYWTW